MTRSHLFTIFATFITAALAWYGVSTYPLGQKHADVISVEGAPQEIITLNASDTISQSFHTLQPLLSSVSVYSANDRLTNQKITLSISDSRGHPLAQSSSARPSYRDEKLKLTFPIDWLETNINQDLIINIKLDSGSPLQLITLAENIYRPGNFSLNGTPHENLDLPLSSVQPTTTPSGIKKGVAAGLIVLLGALIIQLIPPGRHRWRWISAGLLLVIVTPLALGGFWQSRDKLGISDWDHNFAQHEIIRASLLTYHTFPFWNPYTCGGTAGLGDPEFPLFTFTFLLELIFGVPIGLRLAIFLSTAIGALGMLALGKRLRLSINAALLASLIAFFGTANLLEVVEGHPNIFAAMWIPWIFWAWLGAYRSRTSGVSRRGGPILCGVFLALTFLQGGIYLLMYTTLAFILLPFLTSRPRDAVIVTLKAGLWALGLAAIKLVPVLLWLSQFQDESYASSAATLPYLYEIFLGRHLHGVNILPDQATGWHEYGAYIGPLATALALLGLTTNIRRSRLTRALAISAVLAIMLSSAGPILKPVFDQFSFLPRSTISRFILFAVIPIAMLAAIGLNNIKQKTIKLIIVGFVAVDLMSLSYPLSEQAFIVPKDDVQITSAPQPIAFTKDTYEKRLDDIDYTRSYLAVKAGYGNLDYCTPLSPLIGIAFVAGDEVPDYVSITDAGHGTVSLISWSPNKVRVQADINQPTDVVINTNYALGWYVNDLPAQELSNRVGVTLQPGTYSLTFQYRTPGFPPGLVITITTLLAASLLSYRSVQPQSKHQHHPPAWPPPIRPTNRPT
ncbi:MAG: hypothetical protein ABIH36_02615 [bacterium]